MCGTLILARMIHHVAKVLEIAKDKVYTWTNSTVVLGWLHENSNQFKTFVGNHKLQIIKLISPSGWNHKWLCQTKQQWPSMPELHNLPTPSEERKEQQVSLLVNINQLNLLELFSTYSRLKLATSFSFWQLQGSTINEWHTLEWYTRKGSAWSVPCLESNCCNRWVNCVKFCIPFHSQYFYEIVDVSQFRAWFLGSEGRWHVL